MLLEDRVAIVYGGGGRIGGAVARAFGREGARVFLAGRTAEPMEQVAEAIRGAGGTAETGMVDALDEADVERHAQEVTEAAGRIDVSFNAIGHGDVHGQTLLDMPFEDFLRPVVAGVRTTYLTARAAARRMVEQRSGVIMAVTATTARRAIPEVGGTGVAFDAIESLSRQWAADLGPKGVRVVWVRTTGIMEALAPIEVFPAYGTGPEGMPREQFLAWLLQPTMLKRLASLEDAANAAVYLASDWASSITGTGLNLSAGSVID